MKIGILGGSFDPPHIGHLLIARQVREKLGMDQIWLLPNFTHAFEKIQTPSNIRLEMTKLLKNDFIKISDLEIKQKGTSYTIDSLDSFQNLYQENIFFWILGSDQLDVFQKYKDWQSIVKKHFLIIFPRESILSKLREKVLKSLKLKSIPKNIIVMQDLDLILTNISSSIIRRRIKNELSIEYLVPKGIEEYIVKHKLYL